MAGTGVLLASMGPMGLELLPSLALVLGAWLGLSFLVGWMAAVIVGSRRTRAAIGPGVVAAVAGLVVRFLGIDGANLVVWLLLVFVTAVIAAGVQRSLLGSRGAPKRPAPTTESPEP
jgi:hypothetical protein